MANELDKVIDELDLGNPIKLWEMQIREESFYDYPKDYRGNMVWRARMLARAKVDKQYRAKVRALFFKDILFAFNAFFFTFDVRRKPYHHQPFCTYLYQDVTITQLTRAIDGGYDIAGEKSRDMGFSWMVILVYMWFWLNPKGGADFLLGSRIEDYVDKKGDMRTLIQKARYAFYKLPRWIRPKGFRTNTCDNFMKLLNPESGSSITGESNNPNFGTGGRYASCLLDEFAKWESTDRAAWTSLGDATPCRLPVSTPFGAAGQYYEVVTNGKTKKIYLHWSLHPRKNDGLYCEWPLDADTGEPKLRSIWYDLEVARRSETEIAQELDINYIGAGNPAFGGKAGKRIARLMKLGKEPLATYRIDLPTMSLVEVDTLVDYEGYFQLFEHPTKRGEEVLGVDVVEGKEDGDYASVKVISRESKSVVGSYFSKVDEVTLAKIVTAIARWFGSRSKSAPWVGIETNSPGLATFDFCWEYDLENLFMMPNYDSARQSESFTKGWRTTQSSRKILVAGIKEWLLEQRGWADARLLREMTTFVINKQGKPEAKTGANDDEVMAFGVGLQVDVLAPYTNYQEEVKRREDGLPVEMFEPLVRSEEKILTPFELCLATLAQGKLERSEVMEEL